MDALTETMKYSGSIEERETNSSIGEHKWQIYIDILLHRKLSLSLKCQLTTFQL